jgi:hypothetical protein
MTFGHREHLHLAWQALETSDAIEAATEHVSAQVQAIATAHGAPQKYNQPVTTAGVCIVAHVRKAHAVRSFDELLAVAPWLFDKRLLLRHYTSRTLASPQARVSYVSPDLLAIP